MKSFFQNTVNSANASSTAVVVRAAETDLTFHITDIIISVGSTISVTLLDDDGNIIMHPCYMLANTTTPISLNSPLVLTEAKGLKAKTSGSGNVSITITGYSED